MFGRSRNNRSAAIPAVCVDVRSITVFTVIGGYRSHCQLLTDLLQLKCGSREWRLEAGAPLMSQGKAQLPCASGIQAMVLKPCPTTIGLLPAICVA
jgi:hypothetical protein